MKYDSHACPKPLENGFRSYKCTLFTRHALACTLFVLLGFRKTKMKAAKLQTRSSSPWTSEM